LDGSGAFATTSHFIRIAGDYDGDGSVGLSDFAALRSSFGAAGANLNADGNGDGIVDLSDFALLRANSGNP
jgi:hypothetical protein